MLLAECSEILRLPNDFCQGRIILRFMINLQHPITIYTHVPEYALPNLDRRGCNDHFLYLSGGCFAVGRRRDALCLCAREMMDRGDWVVPMFNGRMFPDKPPLMYWLMMAGFGLFGQNEFGARFFSAVLGTGTALLTYHLGRLLFNPRVGLWAGLIVASSIIFTVSARAATADSALAFVTTLAVLCFVAALRIQGSGFRVQGSAIERQNCEPQPSLPQFAICHKSLLAFGLFALLYASLGVAILAKGPVMFLLPMVSMGLFLMIVNCRQQTEDSNDAWNVMNWKLRWRPWSGCLVRVIS